MQQENDQKEHPQGQQGSGSSENIGKDRNEQKARMVSVDDDERKDIADQTGLNPEDIADLRELGALAGRDDQAGGSGDRMEETSSNEGTEKF